MNEYLKDLTQIDHLVNLLLIPLAWKMIGAFTIWFVGGFVIRTLQKLSVSGLNRKKVDPTLVHYSNATLGWVLRSLLVLAILGVFGVETTSFSALLAAAGVAIGVAWSGLLSNFAAGIFLILLRPFKVGDAITAAGVTGTVRVIGLFATTIDNADNLRVFVGNNKIFSDNILNYTTNSYRLIPFKIQLAYSVDPKEANEKLKRALGTVEGVQSLPPVSSEITEFNSFGTLVTLRAACHHSVYSSVLAGGNEAIYRTMKEAQFPRAEARTLLIKESI